MSTWAGVCFHFLRELVCSAVQFISWTCWWQRGVWRCGCRWGECVGQPASILSLWELFPRQWQWFQQHSWSDRTQWVAVCTAGITQPSVRCSRTRDYYGKTTKVQVRNCLLTFNITDLCDLEKNNRLKKKKKRIYLQTINSWTRLSMIEELCVWLH